MPKAVSWVLAGGVLAAVIGPQIVIFTKDLLTPFTFAASYLGQAACGLLALVVLQSSSFPRPAVAPRGQARPLGEIVRQPRFIVAVACGVTAYATMNLLMTAAPLAMVGCGHSVSDATLGIQWHVLAMYAPSFVTGSLVVRFGVMRITAIGLALLVLAAVVGVTGLSVAHFWAGLVLIGLGWNLAFIGATTLVTGAHRPEERTRVQSFNDFLIFGSMAVASFSSGQLLAAFGWASVNAVIFPTVAIAFGLLAGWPAPGARRGGVRPSAACLIAFSLSPIWRRRAIGRGRPAAAGKSLRSAEIARHTQVAVGGDRALAEHDFVDAPRRYADGARQRRLRQRHRLKNSSSRISPGCGFGSNSVIVDDRDIFGSSLRPAKDDAPLVIDADAPLPAVALQRSNRLPGGTRRSSTFRGIDETQLPGAWMSKGSRGSVPFQIFSVSPSPS